MENNFEIGCHVQKESIPIKPYWDLFQTFKKNPFNLSLNIKSYILNACSISCSASGSLQGRQLSSRISPCYIPAIVPSGPAEPYLFLFLGSSPDLFPWQAKVWVEQGIIQIHGLHVRCVQLDNY